MNTPTQPLDQPGENPREWVSFVADDGDTWMFDLTFFRSSYQCIYGQGCAGIESEPDANGHRGCCSYGAHFVDDEDMDRVMSVVATLRAEQWENAALFPELGGPDVDVADVIDALTEVDDEGDRITKVVEGACVLLNSPDAATGAGCALHFAAVSAELDPMVWKPEVCWQVPIRVEHHVDDYGRHTHFVRQWVRADWGDDSGIAWWCAEAPEAYTSSQNAARSLRPEVAALAGETIADALIDYIAGAGNVVQLPLPTPKSSEKGAKPISNKNSEG